MVRDVSRQVGTRHPTRNELDWIGGDTQEGDDVRVGQVFPHGRHLVEGLGIPLAPENEERCHQIRTILNSCRSPSGYTIR